MNNFMQMFQMLMSAQNPMLFMQQQLGNNPMFQQAMQMQRGKTPEQLKQVAFNIAKQKNIPVEQVKQMASQINLKI